MDNLKANIVINARILDKFKGSVRIVDKRYWAGIPAIDAKILEKLRAKLPEIVGDKEIAEMYDFAVVAPTREFSKDFKDLGIKEFSVRIKELKSVRGIPVSWHLLKNAGLDYNKINVVLVPKAVR